MSMINDICIVYYRKGATLEIPAEYHGQNDILFVPEGWQVGGEIIEEMMAVLHASERHGMVCPAGRHLTVELPRWSLIPLPDHPCVMCKGEMVRHLGANVGTLEAYSAYVNQYGFSTVSAHRALLPMPGGDMERTDWGGGADQKEKASRLRQEYPYMPGALEWYEWQQIHPFLYFQELLEQDRKKQPKLLYSLYELSLAFNGSSTLALSLLEAFYEKFRGSYDISVLVSRAAEKKYHLSGRYDKIYHPEDLEGVFDIAYIPMQVLEVGHLILLNRHCLRYAFCMLDIISIRSSYLLQKRKEREQIFRDAIRHCDGISFISDFAMEDIMAYYREEFSARALPSRVIYPGAERRKTAPRGRYKLPFDHYFVVMGNTYKHKMLQEFVAYMRRSKYNYIVIGCEDKGYLAGNIYGLRSGRLDKSLIDEIYCSAVAIIYPSIYEGFGLPFLDSAIYGKPLVAYNTQLNRELSSWLEQASHEAGRNVRLVENFEEIEGILDQIMEKTPETAVDGGSGLRNWEQVAEDTERLLREILSAPIEAERLMDRWRYYNYIAEIHKGYSGGMKQRNSISRQRPPWLESFLQGLIDRFPGLYRIYCKAFLYRK